jgi:pantothenate synthetase
VGQIVADLDLPLEVRVLPTVRDGDGLALSSRNVFLSAAERSVALALPRAIEAGAAAQAAGGDPVAAARAVLESERGLTVDYVAVADFDRPTLVAAVRVGQTRLIDNAVLG